MDIEDVKKGLTEKINTSINDKSPETKLTEKYFPKNQMPKDVFENFKRQYHRR
jgi:hypothetical protein